MEKEKLCECGSPADWAEIGSTWICVACRDRDVKKNMDEFIEGLEKLERMEKNLRLLRIDTGSIGGLLRKLKEEINTIGI